jgi:DNA-binding PadR family transcriptional regulator
VETVLFDDQLWFLVAMRRLEKTQHDPRITVEQVQEALAALEYTPDSSWIYDVVAALEDRGYIARDESDFLDSIAQNRARKLWYVQTPEGVALVASWLAQWCSRSEIILLRKAYSMLPYKPTFYVAELCSFGAIEARNQAIRRTSIDAMRHYFIYLVNKGLLVRNYDQPSKKKRYYQLSPRGKAIAEILE